MKEKTLPFSLTDLELITNTIPTPFHLYDERGIRQNAKKFKEAFAWVPAGFKNYFAVKALPNPFIMEILKQEGMGADCSSLGELVLAQSIGLSGDDIVLTSNDTPANEFQKAVELEAIVNLDDVAHLDFLEANVGLPQLLSFRYNPGPILDGNDIIGRPEDAKFGVTREQLFEGYEKAIKKGIKRFGLHTMVASNELNPLYFANTAKTLFELARDLHLKLGITFEFINLGGGIGIPYHPGHAAVDLHAVSHGIQRAFEKYLVPHGLDRTKIVMECGRMVTGPYGYLISKVLHKKKTYKSYVGLDASMSNLMRPGMYGSYHHVTIPAGVGRPVRKFDLTGSLCENNDKFAIDRLLPEPEVGDIVVIHDTGAHGHSMGFQYNAKLRSAEVLLKEDGSAKLIRRAETLTDYFSTLDYPGLV